MIKFPSSYNGALMFVAAGFAAKQMLVKIFLIRLRLGNQTFKWPEDYPNMKLFVPVFKLLMLAFPCSKPEFDDALSRYNAIELNNVDNETYLIMAATAWGALGNPPAFAATLLYSMLGTRTLHNLCFVFKIEPFRTFAYLPGLGFTLYAAVQAILSAK